MRVESSGVTITDDEIRAKCSYQTVVAQQVGDEMVARPITEEFTIHTQRTPKKLGVLLVGVGGNNGTTSVAGLIANKKNITWMTKEGEKSSNWIGSMAMSSTIKIGFDPATMREMYLPVKDVVPLSDPLEWVVNGWDINDAALGDAMKRACVLDYNLQEQLYEDMQKIKPMPGIYIPDFIADNQTERANNILTGSVSELVDRLRSDIRTFKESNQLESVIVLWTANTERYAKIIDGVNDTADNLLASISKGHPEISPSSLYAVASIMERCTYINGSPQNTFVPGVVDLATRHEVFIAGDDFKSGQTKLKSVLMDFLVSAGIKPTSIVSYNHLGNNDGMNLDSYEQFRSKEISKSCVVSDMVSSNPVLYPNGDSPDHVVVIKYVPHVGDSKRAMDEYTSDIFMNGTNTIVIHNTCEDSLLAAPIIYDLILLAELCQRVSFVREGGKPERMHSVLSLLSYLCKAPLVPQGTPVVNALFTQRAALTNFFRAVVGLPPENHMQLENRLASTAGTGFTDVVIGS